MIDFKATVNIKVSQIIAKNERCRRIGQFAISNQIKKDSEYYIPLRDSYLKNSGRVTEKEVSWHTPYARRLYYNPQYNFSKDKNPNAGGKWFELAKISKKDEWVKIAKKAYWMEFGKKGR